MEIDRWFASESAVFSEDPATSAFVARRSATSKTFAWQVDLHGAVAEAHAEDVLVDVLGLRAVAAELREAEEVDPQRAQGVLVAAADRNLLESENAKGPS